ncbi:MAG: 2-oxoacid:acceptor oxidoreductase family protein [Nanoarchaeota archaeon]|nr:2-oxoacid:acceptor oxidoreductase family protein [Nanoarchaeota archaeon]
MKYSVLFGGKAGQGPNILSQLTGEILVEKGYYVFYSRDYQSLIRGGHNFNVLTFSDEPVLSNESKIDILICLDENTEKMHKNELKKTGLVLKGTEDNMYFAGRLFKILGLDFKLLEEKLKKLKNFDENLKHAKKGHETEKNKIEIVKPKNNSKKSFRNGSQAIADGSIKSGLDIYCAYPMTPATPLLFELAPRQFDNNFLTLELENEISVIGSAVGAAATGAKAMVGTSGGGFDLMTEFFSMSAIAEIPIVVYLSSRPGPGTGVATYTGQGDLNLARHCGHGEFFRLVLAPGDSIESEELTSQCFYFSQKYKIPAILLGDKHLGESFYTSEANAKITKSEKTISLKKFNSYETDENGIGTENAEIIKKNVERRLKKTKEIEKEAEKFEMFKVYGKKDSKNIIVSWGSTKGAIIDAIKDLDCKFIQILYIEPFSEKIKIELAKAKNIILVENNTGTLADLIGEKTCIRIEDKNKILRYDGRPFLCDELNEEIKGRLR